MHWTFGGIQTPLSGWREGHGSVMHGRVNGRFRLKPAIIQQQHGGPPLYIYKRRGDGGEPQMGEWVGNVDDT